MTWGDYLLPQSALETCTGSADQIFVCISKIITKNYDALIENNRDHLGLRVAVIEQINAIAAELGIEGLFHVDSSDFEDFEFVRFMESVSAVKSRIAVKSKIAHEPSVNLKKSSKRRIKTEIERLKNIVSESDLENSERQSLIKKIEDVERELDGARPDVAKILMNLSLVATICGATISALADAPDAAQVLFNILEVIGEEYEDSPLRLPAPLKALPAPDSDTTIV